MYNIFLGHSSEDRISRFCHAAAKKCCGSGYCLICEICESTFTKPSDLEEHVRSIHKFNCGMCAFRGTTISIVEHHILDKHCLPDKDGNFSCDECNFTCDKKDKLYSHFKAVHKNNEKSAIEETPERDEEVEKLKDELRRLKNNFERLDGLFQEALEEANKTKSEYEAKLIDANDKLRVAKSENEELKERVDVLFKLGRGYINKKEHSNSSLSKPTTPKKTSKGAENTEEIIEDDDVTDEDLTTWTQNKLRGFKRSGPSSAPEKLNKTKNSQKPLPPNPPNNPLTSPTHPSPPRSPQKSSHTDSMSESENMGKLKYCHFFSNYGKCLFEERTEKRCKFLHEKAPICRSGTSCTRNKCMYKHPNIPTRNSFLSPGTTFPMHMNPWQMMSPWLNPSANLPQYPAIWNTGFQNPGNQQRN